MKLLSYTLNSARCLQNPFVSILIAMLICHAYAYMQMK